MIFINFTGIPLPCNTESRPGHHRLSKATDICADDQWVLTWSYLIELTILIELTVLELTWLSLLIAFNVNFCLLKPNSLGRKTIFSGIALYIRNSKSKCLPNSMNTFNGLMDFTNDGSLSEDLIWWDVSNESIVWMNSKWMYEWSLRMRPESTSHLVGLVIIEHDARVRSILFSPLCAEKVYGLPCLFRRIGHLPLWNHQLTHLNHQFA